MLKRLLSLFNRTPSTGELIQRLLVQAKSIDPKLIARRYEYNKHGLMLIEMRTPNATALYDRLVKVRNQLKAQNTIKPFELGTPLLRYLDDYLIDQPGVTLDLAVYFQSLKEVSVDLLTLLHASAQTQEAEYYRVRTQLLMDDLKTFFDIVLKL